MSEAGKEILLREALASHMRSTRDRKLVMDAFGEKQSLEDIISYFGAFYLYNYQGVKLHQIDVSQDLSIEQMEELDKKERSQLEVEVRQLLSDKLREEIDVLRLVSEFNLELVETLGNMDPASDEAKSSAKTTLLRFLGMIPESYAPNNDIDFINEATGWGNKWRNEVYVKASGLKESAMSLREELLKTHDAEVAETTVLKQGITAVLGRTEFLSKRISEMDIPDSNWDEVVTSIIERLFQNNIPHSVIKGVHTIRLNVLEILESEIEVPTTLGEYETRFGAEIAQPISELIRNNPGELHNIIGEFVGLPAHDVSALFRSERLTDPIAIADGLLESGTQSDVPTEQSTHTTEELETITRKLRTLEKLEHNLEKPVKGMLRAKGLRAAELDKISIELLLKNRDSLIGIEIEVLEALKRNVRIPSPEEIQKLLDLRDEVKSGAIGGAAISSSSEIGRKLQHGDAIASLRLDLIWHLTIGFLKNLSRVVEIYIRSKQDLLRCKAILKSIYDDSDTEMQFLREEILIDLAAMRLYELKIIHPELSATSICSWYQARLSNSDIDSAKKHLASSASPVFEGISDEGLKMDKLSFDNYAIAFDLMQRFIERQRQEKFAKEEFVLESKRKKQKRAESKKKAVDVFGFVYMKSQTVFRAIGRVGARGLEWTPMDDSKCANLLAYYLNAQRSKPICAACGESPSGNKCSKHGKGHINVSNDIDNLSLFVMRAFTDIKEGLLGAKAEPMKWDEARSLVQKELSALKRRGKITSKTNVKALLPGEINYIVGPAITTIIGRYFNESLEYAARRANIA